MKKNQPPQKSNANLPQKSTANLSQTDNKQLKPGQNQQAQPNQPKNQPPQNIEKVEENKPNWQVLSTGLQMMFSEEAIQKIWAFDKPKIAILDFLNDFMKRLGIQKNFESMEINIIAEFHLYNLIFIKEHLSLNNYKAAILLNLLWTLLINDNKDYQFLHKNYSKIDIQQVSNINIEKGQKTHENIKSLQQIEDVDHKTIQRDLENFKYWILRHAKNDPPQSLQIFDQNQIKTIIQFVEESYFSNFELYKYCLNNKKKNEEIQINVYVDQPMQIPPLADALYMGQTKIEVQDDEDEIQQDGNNSSGLNDYVQEDEVQNILESHNEKNDEVEKIKQIVEEKVKQIEEQFKENLALKQEELNKKLDDILNAGKKKK